MSFNNPSSYIKRGSEYNVITQCADYILKQLIYPQGCANLICFSKELLNKDTFLILRVFRGKHELWNWKYVSSEWDFKSCTAYQKERFLNGLQYIMADLSYSVSFDYIVLLFDSFILEVFVFILLLLFACLYITVTNQVALQVGSHIKYR